MYDIMLFTIFLLEQTVVTASTPENPSIHFALHRRGGQFTHHEPVDLFNLYQVLQQTESRYNGVHRVVNDNHLVRRWNPGDEARAMLDQAGLLGRWYTTILIGDPPQSVHADLDFLSPDFYTLLTTSNEGSKFNTFGSRSHSITYEILSSDDTTDSLLVPSQEYVHPLCRLTSDRFHFSNRPNPLQVDWPICQPSKSSRHTLSHSGTILGLAPNTRSGTSSLSQLSSPSLIYVLHQKSITRSPIWSMTLLDGSTGILSIGGSLAAEFEEAKSRAEAELKYMGNDNATLLIEEEVRGKMAFAFPSTSNVEDHFKWMDVSGVSGWWTGLMGAVWVNGNKVMKNQPFLIDLSCPFIIAPPTAFSRLYDSIGGSKPVPSLLNQISNTNNTSFISPSHPQIQENFRLFPCLNPPAISFDLSGWPFPFAHPSSVTNEDGLHGPAGGPFSLGKIEESMHQDHNNQVDGVNSGFCVGIVVRSDMGHRADKKWRDSGMQDTWVLGEPFFRGLGIIFDGGNDKDKKARMGFRRY